ncbi:hypothetical protein TRFO_26285 [Tritrichomonas foetus]|uniref:Uncharacterized protein n=1 Tax=Tritrichomonas foetus TaxID=1144522 RepID=A0A1J4K4S3_9EUKA|nr:hypothetical protein TRFO_26285 [Tritrichomonas foetus]|eukprot:OHT05856.1 hypothetical protein TRFO_26285 [Tritrichomonas foetus]
MSPPTSRWNSIIILSNNKKDFEKVYQLDQFGRNIEKFGKSKRRVFDTPSYVKDYATKWINLVDQINQTTNEKTYFHCLKMKRKSRKSSTMKCLKAEKSPVNSPDCENVELEICQKPICDYNDNNISNSSIENNNNAHESSDAATDLVEHDFDEFYTKPSHLEEEANLELDYEFYMSFLNLY